MFKHTHVHTLTVDLKDMANKENGYSPNLPHPMNTYVHFKNTKGNVITIRLGNLTQLVAIFNGLSDGNSAPGPTLDKLYAFLKNQASEDVLNKALEFDM